MCPPVVTRLIIWVSPWMARRWWVAVCCRCSRRRIPVSTGTRATRTTPSSLTATEPCSAPLLMRFVPSLRGKLSSARIRVLHFLTVCSGFFITYMGSALGTSPGRLVETDAGGNIIHEWPEDVDSTVSSVREENILLQSMLIIASSTFLGSSSALTVLALTLRRTSS